MKPQLKEINGRYYQEAEVVMLATDKRTRIDKIRNSLRYSIYLIPSNAFSEFQHLYIISNEEIKEGDWYIDDINTIRQSITSDKDYWAVRQDYKKIIATTNTSLYVPITQDKPFDELPQPSDSFIKKYIEEYNKGDVITNVLVEYEIGKSYSGNSGLEIKQWLKVDSNNTITIKRLEPELYTREEVKILLQKSLLFAFKEGNNHVGSNLPFLRTTMDNWIKQNLKYKKAKH